MYPSKKVVTKLSPREISIIQKAKAYDVDFLANEFLAKELFDFEVADVFEKEGLDSLLLIEKLAKESIKSAQMSNT